MTTVIGQFTSAPLGPDFHVWTIAAQDAVEERDQKSSLDRADDLLSSRDVDVCEIDKAFFLALVLSQDVGLAESIVANAIETVEDEGVSGPLLFAQVGRLAWRATKQPSSLVSSGDPDLCKMLPAELARVSTLSRVPRFCFCLRVLAGMSASACGRMILLEAAEVDDYLAAAVNQLSVKQE